MIATLSDATLQTRVVTPIGTITLTSNGQALTRLWLTDTDLGDDGTVPSEEDAVLAAAREQAHGTEFQRRVWDSLKRIPFGETISYAELARRVDNPKAVRAVGAANGRNPLMIIVPCHRVIGADGSLTGFGAGIERKRWLLDHETRVLQR
jgi:methylated-DNA-[protein]-cysteine S-methyltransferase